jgi:SAM-dependent methyltransferase
MQPRGAYIVAAHDDRPALPLANETFDLVTSRHPIETWWEEIARVLRRGGTFLSQQVGAHSVGELLLSHGNQATADRSFRGAVRRACGLAGPRIARPFASCACAKVSQKGVLW